MRTHRIQFRYIFICFISLTFIIFCSCKREKDPIKPIRYTGSYNRDFNDLNELHLESAKSLGIKPVKSREDAEAQKGNLQEIQSCSTYEVMELTHSLPFLVPPAADLLDQIGENFCDSLKKHNAPCYKLRVTSILRTENDITKLRKRNGNSTQNSAHLYGTTFDIAWNRYTKVDQKDTLLLPPEELKKVLASVLRDLKKEKCCYVKHEKKQGCFHITVRNNKL